MGIFNIITMEQKHLDVVSQIESECFSDPWTYSQFEEALKSEYIICTCAIIGDKPVGYLIMYDIAGEGQITNVAVKKEYRQLGIGRTLLIYADERAKDRNIKRLTLEVRITNQPAISLYKSIGFSEDGIRPNFYEHPREDALLMSKDII